jgi:hypothetical protein
MRPCGYYDPGLFLINLSLDRHNRDRCGRQHRLFVTEFFKPLNEKENMSSVESDEKPKKPSVNLNQRNCWEFFNISQSAGKGIQNWNGGRKVMKKNGSTCMVIWCLILLSVISCAKKYVGVRQNTSRWCKINNLPSKCSYQDKYFSWDFTISKVEKGQEYIVQGSANGSKGDVKSIGRLDHAKSQFYLVMAYKDVIVDTVPLTLMGDDILSPIPFKQKFSYEGNFDAAAIFWEAYLRG